MRITVGSITLMCIFLLGCKLRHDATGVYISESRSQLLLVKHGEWKVLHSGVGTLCDRFKILNGTNLQGYLTPKTTTRSKYYGADSLKYTCSNNEIILENIKFQLLEEIEWDSIVITNYRNNSTINKKVLLPSLLNKLEVDLLASTIYVKDFKYIDTSMVETNHRVLLELFKGNKIIGTKIGANKFICIDV